MLHMACLHESHVDAEKNLEHSFHGCLRGYEAALQRGETCSIVMQLSLHPQELFDIVLQGDFVPQARLTNPEQSSSMKQASRAGFVLDTDNSRKSMMC